MEEKILARKDTKEEVLRFITNGEPDIKRLLDMNGIEDNEDNYIILSIDPVE